jgi:hypothetical protein
MPVAHGILPKLENFEFNKASGSESILIGNAAPNQLLRLAIAITTHALFPHVASTMIPRHESDRATAVPVPDGPALARDFLTKDWGYGELRNTQAFAPGIRDTGKAMYRAELWCRCTAFLELPKRCGRTSGAVVDRPALSQAGAHVADQQVVTGEPGTTEFQASA